MRMYGSDVLAGADLAVPVPLHWRRHWQRGFNQALELSRDLGLPVRQVLRRCRHTRSQADLSADERDANVRGAFRTTRGTRLAGLVIVLIDDVRTTGKTLEACANVVMAAGAREVRTLTAARVVTRLPAGRPH
jgi:ComF family protein